MTGTSSYGSAFQGTKEPIAIVGSGCRFSGESTTPSKLWDLLRSPRDVASKIPESRFNVAAFYHEDGSHHGTSNVTESYILSEDHRHFDATFFGIKPKEAASIDPQQRILLETVYEGLESAGISLGQLQGTNTAVYVGVMTGDYADLLNRDLDQFPQYHATGTSRAILSNRISYFFDWHGPSMTIDTACSSSLIALHQAVQVLRSGESQVAIAAGTNLILGPEPYIAESKLKMLSPNGRSRMWDSKADGYARGDGIAAVVLKTLSAALADGDHIHALVRETGTNQDGRTKGITMPSSVAQANLIRDTYVRAGLDITKASDRPQFFEAHGTGTPAGDPIEAEAISTAFFSGENEQHQELYVGSIKTVLGHTEGTAGLAGVLKAVKAIESGIIPPNLLFEHLNPAIEPFYGRLQIPTSARQWPDTLGGPRRVSVNSFGFGGANAHAIIERFEPGKVINREPSSSTAVFTPFVFSAATEGSLVANIKAYSSFIKLNCSNVNANDLAFTLNTRRSVLPYRATFSADNLDYLVEQLDKSTSGSTPIGIVAGRPAVTTGPSILGIFTGQGAQWAGMGRQLILSSRWAASFIGRLEDSLANLPHSDRPAWSLTKEILADSSTSRIGEAALSQPLCTAIQVLLIELLHAAGIKFTAVVGHSSGEIAAAYAAGSITTPEDALHIAYYRGLHAALASGPKGQKGAMLAVGTSLEDARELTALPDFEGRITVAASNSPSSVTLSGDEDAVSQAKDVFEEEKKFVRLLKVEKAYHSHHMFKASDSYLASIRAAGIAKLKTPNGTTSWYSSVLVQKIVSSDDVADTYWNDNMVNPVLFSQAISLAVSEEGPFDIAIEVGPHPALKGPVLQTIQDISNGTLSYTGTLQRATNDVEALSNALGQLWKTLPESSISFTRYDTLLSGVTDRNLVVNLPGYQWDHGRKFWHESRLSRAQRLRTEPIHEILGTRVTDGAQNQLRWRNVLTQRHIPWLSGHQIQGQVVFPAAAYLSAVFEASRFAAGTKPIKLIEVLDVSIAQAIPFDDEDAATETLFTLTEILKNENTIEASWNFYSAPSGESLDLILNANGKVLIELGDAGDDPLLAISKLETYNLIDLGADRFYNSLDEVGYRYSGPFKALKNLRRRLGFATGSIAKEAASSETGLLVHPGPLDAAIQSVILAFSWPGDGRLKQIHVPTNIKRIRVNPSLWLANIQKTEDLTFDATIGGDSRSGIEGDIDIFTSDRRHNILQIEGVLARPFSVPTAADDFHLFSEMIWDSAVPNGETVAENRASELDYELAYLFERIAYYYLKSIVELYPLDKRAYLEDHHKSLLHFADDVVLTAATGKHQYIKKQWRDDTHEGILDLIGKYPDNIDLRIMHSIGENLPAVLRGETTILEHMRKDNMLDEYYVDAIGFHPYMNSLGRLVGQLVHRYPHMDILEIGSGTGGATKYVLREIETTFKSYSYTDISGGFFENAQKVFKKQAAKMKFKTLNIEQDPTTQGFEAHSYDLIIASLVLHATEKLEETLRNVRRLLKPGGYLVILEITNNGQARLGYIFGTLPGWWLGKDDGRILTPCVTASEWGSALSNTGFNGIETITPDLDNFPYPISVIAAQAVDDRIGFLRNPLSTPTYDASIENLTILGGATSISLQLIGKVIGQLRPFAKNIYRIDGLSDSLASELPSNGTVISFLDLDARVFKPLTTTSIEALKTLFQNSKNVMWVTRNARTDDPIANTTYGFGRTLLLELPHLRLQYLDLGPETRDDARVVSETLLRFFVAADWENKHDERILWSTEPEIAYEEGRYLIPRLKLQKDRNSRYNSSKRLIHHQARAENMLLKVVHENGQHSLREVPSWLSTESHDTETHELIKVAFSSLQAIKTQSGHLFFILGYKSNNEPVVTFSNELRSRLWAPRDSLISIKQLEGLEVPQFLINFIIAKSILLQLSKSDQLIVLDANKQIRHHLQQLASKQQIKLTLLTTSPAQLEDGQVQIHINASRRSIGDRIPAQASKFVSFSHHKILARQILDLLSFARYEDFTTLTSRDSRPGPLLQPRALADLLEEGVTLAESVQIAENSSSSLLSLLDFPVDIDNASGTQVQLINWQAPSQEVSVQVESTESTIRFRNDRTYWLVGLTGGLGLSLTSWMVARGARNIVISSRNPKVDSSWLDSLAQLGANVYVWANDITKRESVQDIFKRIASELPPLAGIAQGAMVLRDALFVDSNFENMRQVLAPKTNGSKYLEELLGEYDLDFYIFFSSMVAVTGNGGQSAYSAANAYMTTLAAQRRTRGLAASVIHIGAIVGTGYVTRELTEIQQKALRSYGNIWMSEQDFHNIFAEAVISSHPRNKLNHEIMTGLRIIDSDAPDKTNWFYNAKFGHMVVHRGTSEGVNSSTSKAAPVRVQLHGATSSQQVAEILRSAFTYKLQLTLQMNDEEALQRLATLDAGADELGIDSLVAVDLRSWFLKELEVDMPVLKILGGASLGDLLIFALEKLSPTLVPNLGKALETITTADLVKSSTLVPAPKSDTPPAPSPQASWQEEPPIIESETKRLTVGQISASPSPPLARSESSYSSSSISSFDKVESIQSWDALSESDIQPSLDQNSFSRTLTLSSGQSRFYFLQQYLKDKTTFNITCSISLQGNLRVPDLEQAIVQVAQRHTALRTAFFIGDDGEPKQGILEKPLLYLEKKGIQNESEVTLEFQKTKAHIYKLDQGQTMRVILLSLSASKHQLIIGYHHINFDGISLEVFLGDIQKAYDGQKLGDNVLQYSDYAHQQEQKHKTGQLKSELLYWSKELANLPSHPLPVFALSGRTSRQPLTDYAFNHADVRLDPKIARAIESVSRRAKSTPFHFHLAALRSLILRQIKERELVIGIADGNRGDAATQDSLGPYINLIPLRFKTSSHQTFVNAVKEAKAKAYEALSNSRVPFDVLLSELQAPRSNLHTPVFQVLLNYRLGIDENRPFIGCATEGLQFESGRTSDDIVLDIVDNVGGSPLLRLNVQSSIYSTKDAETLLQSYVTLLEAFSRNPDQGITEPSLYKQAQINRAIEIGRGPVVKSRWEPTISHQVDQIARLHGNDAAVVDANTRWTYNQLADQVVNIASNLLDAGASPGSTVAVFVEPSAEWIASLLAIHRIGGIYVPLDPRVHIARLSSIVNDSRPTSIIYHTPTQSLVNSLELSVRPNQINLSTIPVSRSSSTNIARSDAIAALIYTSGTTGLPKGIEVVQSGVLNQIEAATSAFGLGRETVLQQGAYSFDISVWQAFFALVNGGTLVIASKSARLDQSALLDLIVAENVTVAAATPSEFQAWFALDSGRLRRSSLRLAIAGGERVTSSLLDVFRQLQQPSLRLFNAYGPSEISIASNVTELDYNRQIGPDEVIAVGPSLTNYSVYILDEDLRPVPIGVPGEVYIGGAGVARGYLNNKTLTTEKFIKDRFVSTSFQNQGWNVVHRSGDRGRLQNDGSLVIEGRIDGDTQVKLRGIRIDLQDIESVVLKQSSGSIENVVVSVRSLESNSPEILVAHAVLAKDANVEDVSGYLNNIRIALPLPKYMIPTIITHIDRLPLGVSGKISRALIKELPLPETATDQETSVTLSPEEEKVKNIWLEILTHRGKSIAIYPQTDFFQAGGNSLLLVQLQKAIKKTTEIDIPLVALFESITLREMATRIYQKETKATTSAINWDEEIKLPSQLNSSSLATVSTRPPSPGPVRVVILTGATGFLGRALLRDLLEDRNVEKIHAIAVRSPEALSAFSTSWKVEVHPGDLSAPLLGLDTITAERIFSEADAVIHNGADVSFLKTYPSLRPANVNSTKELIQLSVYHGLAFHYISTAGVAQLTGQDQVLPVALGKYQPPPDGLAGYISGKWVSEQLLEAASKHFGLRVWIHRPSNITGDGAPSDDIMQNLLNYSRQLKTIPKFKKLKGYLNFVPVDQVAQDTIQDVVNSRRSTPSGQVVYAHQVSDSDIALSGMRRHLEKESGRKFKQKALAEWVLDAKKAGLAEVVGEFLISLDDVPIVLPRLLR